MNCDALRTAERRRTVCRARSHCMDTRRAARAAFRPCRSICLTPNCRPLHLRVERWPLRKDGELKS